MRIRVPVMTPGTPLTGCSQAFRVTSSVMRPATPTPGADATRHGGDIQADVSTGVLPVRSMARMLDVLN